MFLTQVVDLTMVLLLLTLVSFKTKQPIILLTYLSHVDHLFVLRTFLISFTLYHLLSETLLKEQVFPQLIESFELFDRALLF
jgi:hypothetical protein